MPAVGGIAARDVLVWLPPEVGRPCPVLYLHDGQNLFDATAGVPSWAADEAAAVVAADGLPVILVGVPHADMDRVHEYTPWPDPRLGAAGRGEAHLAYLTDVVVPAVEGSWPVRRDTAGRGIGGSSLGGLMSLCAAARRPDLFGFCAALSPALDAGGGAIYPEVATARRFAPRVHLDMGGDEPVLAFGREVADGDPPWVLDARRMREVLEGRGTEVRYVEDPSAPHHESAWRQRFPGALRWFAEAAWAAAGAT